jgi:hypothetical protein
MNDESNGHDRSSLGVPRSSFLQHPVNGCKSRARQRISQSRQPGITEISYYFS